MIYLNAYKKDTAQALFVYATTLSCESTNKLECEIEDPGEAVVNPEILIAGLMKRDPVLEAEVEIVETKKDGRRLRIKIGSQGTISCALDPNGTEYLSKRMRAVPFRGEAVCKVDGSVLNDFVRRTLFCIPENDNQQNKYQMGGLKLFITEEGAVGWGTNGKALARIVIKGTFESGLDKILIPKESLGPFSTFIKKTEDIEVVKGPVNGAGTTAKLYFHIGNTFFGTQLIEGIYPNLDMALKQHEPEFWFTVNRQDLADCLARCPKFDDGVGTIEVDILGDKMSMRTRGSAGAKNTIEDTLAITRNVPEGKKVLPSDQKINIKINMNQLANVAACEKTECMLIGVSTAPVKALVVHDENDVIVSRYALMPMRAS